MISKIKTWRASPGHLHKGKHAEARSISAEPSAVPLQHNPLSADRLTRFLRDLWFLFGMVLLAGATIFVEAHAGAVLTQQARVLHSSPLSGPTPVVTTRTAKMRFYPFPPVANLMQPSVDAQGNVWVGEMGTGYLARLNTHTGGITTWLPPQSRNGIMTTTVDRQGNVWFVEQGANYLGRFDPGRQTFRIFPLGTVDGRPMGPQSLQFDTSGRLWFTATVGGRIGRLDPATGTIQSWPLPAPTAGIPALPFSLAVTPTGQVWFGLLSGGAVGVLDPRTGQVTLVRLADAQAQIFSMASDDRGHIWFTGIASGTFGRIDTTTGNVFESRMPALAGKPAFLYGVVATRNGDVWFANNGASALVRYEPDKHTYTFFPLSTPSTSPYGLTLAPAGTLWFTVGGTAANFVGGMTLS